MLAAADVQIDILPICLGFGRHKLVVIVRIHIPQPIPRTSGPTWHRIQFERKNIEVVDFVIRNDFVVYREAIGASWDRNWLFRRK